jgi:endonuclease-3
MTETRAQKILDCLEQEFPKATKYTPRTNNPFKTLIATILSQNTNDKNSAKAFSNLSNQFCITPKAIANADVNTLSECLKVGGLYRNKANAIKHVAKKILEDDKCRFDEIAEMSVEKARKNLMALPQVGPKTADVVLLFSMEKPTLPIDTHVNRVAKRLHFASDKGDYETVRHSLQAVFKPKDYMCVHITLIALGRKYCRARNPLCSKCPVNLFCPSRTDVKMNE